MEATNTRTISNPELEKMVDRIAVEQGVESPLVHAVIRAESNYNPNAVSPKGAQGLMQLIPSTARRFGVSNPFDVAENIQGGVRYLRFLLDHYQGDYPKAIAAYNAGEGAVNKYHGVPPYTETQTYVRRVAKGLEAGRQKPASPAAPAPLNSETPGHILASVGTDGRIYYRTP
jgi:soluble lytic murein transglycosylase-like protein